MFGLLNQTSKKPSTRRARLCLEALEDRAVPTGLIAAPAANLSMSIAYDTGRWITLSGWYTSAGNVSNVPIQITGQAQAVAFTNFQGQYSILVEAEALGMMTAQAADLSTPAVSEMLTDQAPVLTSFTVSEEPTCHLFSGTVTYHRAIGEDTMYVRFGGEVQTMQGKTTEVTPNSAFAEAWILNGQQSDNGTCWAEVISPWGLVSNRLEVEVFQTPPN